MLKSVTQPGWSGSVKAAWNAFEYTESTPEYRTINVVDHGIRQAVDLIACSLFPDADGKWPVPSAGGIYPFTVLVVTIVESSWQVFRLPGRGQVIRADVPPGQAAALATALDPARSDRSCHVLLLLRPWLSMRKYGPRGYLYAQLDAAHAAANLTGATPSDWRPVLRVGPDPFAIEAAAEAAVPPFHEIHSVLSFESSHVVDPAPVAVRVPHGRAAFPEPDPVEALCWAFLVGTLQRGDPPPSAPVPTALPATTGESSNDWRRWRRWAAARRSCRRFDGPRLEALTLLRTLSVLEVRLPLNFGETDVGEVRATVVLGPGYDVDERIRACLAPYGDVVTWPDDLCTEELVRACGSQEHAADAQAFVLLHHPASRIVVEGRPDLLRAALFRAGCAAHLIQLGAAGTGVAVLTIGRFDQAVWSNAGRLDADDQVLYLMALGTAKEGT